MSFAIKQASMTDIKTGLPLAFIDSVYYQIIH